MTEEVRESGRRVGFEVRTFGGERAVLAHVDFRGSVHVSRYGVDVEAFERLALPALEAAADRDAVVVDELGKMELASKPFREAATALFEQSLPIVATIQRARHPFTGRLQRRGDVETVSVTERNRDELPEELTRRLLDER